MRTLRLLLVSIAVLLAAGSYATALARTNDKPEKDKPEKAEKAEEKAADKADKKDGKSDNGAGNDDKVAKDEKAEKAEKAEKERNPNAAVPEHPHGAPPGLSKDPGDPAAPGLPTPPALGETIGFKPKPGGDVKIQLPGSEEWVTLTEGQTVPMGSTVDATEGLVEVVAEANTTGERQNALVFGSVFKVDQTQPAGEPAPIVDLVMKGGDFDSCKAAKKDDDGDDAQPTARAAAASKKRGKAGIVRGLWASGKGRFRTRGRHSSATVRGTRWATVDRCHSTTVKVFEGVVDVMDFELDRVFTVRAGERHVARGNRS